MLNKILVFSFSLLLCACVGQAKTPLVSPKAPLKQGMVVTANPLATQAGVDVLEAGGSAVDAAIAIEAVLSLVEPQSSGLAGGGFMVYFDNSNKQLAIYDGRETAPEGVTDNMFLKDDGKSIGFLNAKNSGLSTGVPGMVAMLKMAHEDHGVIPWGPHFNAAKLLANKGFKISPRLHGMIKRFGKYIPSKPEDGPTDAYHYFHNENGEPLKVGDLLVNKDYAKALEIIANDPRAFYTGEIADAIIEQTSALPRAGSLTKADLSSYRPLKKTAVCAPYGGRQICGPPPPSSWLAVAQTMGLIDTSKPFTDAGSTDPKNWVEFAKAQRLAYADRDQFVGDSDFVKVPVSGLLSPSYWQQRVTETDPSKAPEALEAGNPWAFEPNKKVAYGRDFTQDMAGTTHFVVVDGDGNVVSMTASVESIFGSTRMALGMFLNNQLTDFSFRPKDEQGRDVANRIESGKRPRSSMSPTIVLDENGEFLMATGSPGGNSIIAYTAKTLVGVFEWGLTPQESVELPNLVARGKSVRIEKDRASPEIVQGLKDYGFNVKESAGENSGLSVVVKRADGSLLGGVDSRREGTIEAVNIVSKLKAEK